MLIQLISEQVIRPRGEIELTANGVEINTAGNLHIIPYPQVKWIFRGRDNEEEDKMALSIKEKDVVNPLGDITSKTSEDLIKELYMKKGF